jgi:prefoldin subunit 5
MTQTPSSPPKRKAPPAAAPVGARSTTTEITLPILNKIDIGTLTKADLSALRRLGNDTIVSVGGVTGVFTPITGGENTPVTADERKNLLTIIDQLKKELAAKQDTILNLQQQLSTLRDMPSSAPEDFATAMQQSLDEMQQRMANMRNGVSNFAVRDFKLDASVFVQVTPTGSVAYRFVQPGEDIEAAAVSRLSLNVVPIPKNDARGVWTSNLFQPEVPISALPEVDATLAARLEKAGIYSIGEFVQTATRARAQAQLEALLGVQRERLALWAQQAALMTLRGVNGAAATVLIQAGLGSFDALAANPAALVRERYEKTRQAMNVNAPVADEAMAAQWVRAARQYLGLPDLADSA